jgi:hypothetical protein
MPPIKIIQYGSVLWMLFCIIFFILFITSLIIATYLLILNRNIFRQSKSANSDNYIQNKIPCNLPRLVVVGTTANGPEIVGATINVSVFPNNNPIGYLDKKNNV